MKTFKCSWQVWEHGAPEDGSRNSDAPHKLASGEVVKTGENAKALESEWRALIVQAFPENTATTTREYIFSASPI